MHDVVFLFDVDNTLIDNDRIQQDLREHLEESYGRAARERYWAIFDELWAELGYADYIGALERYRAEKLHDPTLLRMANWLLDYPFAERLYTGALDTVIHVRQWGLTSIVASWMTQQSRVRAKQLAQHKRRRIILYNEFIEEASKLFVDALEHETPNPSAMVGLYTTISRMRILSSAAVMECAEKVGDVIVDTYLAPETTPDELRETLKSRTFHSFDYLRDFSKVCRAERGTDLPQQI